MTRLPALGRGRLRNPWQIAALILCAAHLLIAMLYPLGLAVSKVPFTSDSAQSALTSPVVPLSHVLAAATLLAGVYFGRWRDVASVTSCTVWLAYCAALALSSYLRTPHLSMVGSVMAFSLALVAIGLVRCWEHDE